MSLLTRPSYDIEEFTLLLYSAVGPDLELMKRALNLVA